MSVLLNTNGAKRCVRCPACGLWRMESILSIYGRIAVEFLDPLGRGRKPSHISGGLCWLNLVSIYLFISIKQFNPATLKRCLIILVNYLFILFFQLHKWIKDS